MRRVLWTELRILVRDTGRVWWRLLALIMAVYLLGCWLGSELTLRVAVIAGDISARLALARRSRQHSLQHSAAGRLCRGPGHIGTTAVTGPVEAVG